MQPTFCFNFSRAILCYLVNKYGQESTETQQLYPKDPELRANVDRMLFYDSGSLYKNVIDYFVRKTWNLFNNRGLKNSIYAFYILKINRAMFKDYIWF